MDKLFKKYKSDIIYLIIITITFIVLSLLLTRYLLNIFIDFGREAYFPELMIKGKLLYKDLFNLFGPLGYQINEILYAMLGIKVSTLRVAGNICSILILYLTYFISRFFLNSNISFSITLLVLTTCVFSPSVFNFIYPYSYSLLYAFTSFLGSLLLFLISLKSDKQKYFLFGSFFLIGISISAKYEYSLFAFVLIMYSIFVFKQTFLEFIANIILLLSVPIISYGYLFYQGVTLNDFAQNFYYLKNYIMSDSLKYFYSHSVGTLFSVALFDKINFEHLIFAIIFLFLYFVLCFIVIKYKKYFHKSFYPELFLFLFGFLIGFKWLYPRQIYLFMPYLIYVISIYYFIKNFKFKSFNFKNNIYLILLLASLISIVKTAFILDIKIYGTFSFILPFIAVVYFIKKYISKYNILKSVDFIFVFILILSTTALYHTYEDFSLRTATIKTLKSEFFMNPIAEKSISELLIYIKNNVSKRQSLIVLPEGVFINYITDRDMKLYKYYSILPPHMEAFGVKKIIKDFQNAKIDYIVITPRVMDEYGLDKMFCDNYNIENKTQDDLRMFCSFIYDNYNLVKRIDNIYTFKIFKLK